MTVCPTRPGFTVRESQILHLLEGGSSPQRVAEIGAYRRAWSRADVLRMVEARKAAEWEPPVFLGERRPEVVLTPAQAAVLDQLCHGLPNRAIGHVLDVSEDTIKSHMKALLTALNARDRTHAVVLAITGQVRIVVRGVGHPRRAA